MAVATAIMAAAAVAGAVASSRASSKAAKAQKKATNAAIGTNNELLGPYSAAGIRAIPALEQFIGSGENFYDTQAFKDITNSAKAGGQYDSGNRQTALTDYYATNFRPQRLNELGYLFGTGANAANAQAGNISGLQQNLGNINAQNAMNRGAAWSSGIQGVAGAFGGGGTNFSSLLNKYNLGDWNTQDRGGMGPAGYTGYGMAQQNPQQRYSSNW